MLIKRQSAAIAVATSLLFAACSTALEGDSPNRSGSMSSTGMAMAADTSSNGSAALGPDAHFTPNGELIRPTDYRSWVFMGAPLTPNDMNNGKAAFPEFHHVYINRSSFEHYKWTGDFPDGTVIVKELVAVGSKAAQSGNGYFAGEFIGVEAMVKSAERYPDRTGSWGFFRYTDEEAARQGRLGTLKRSAPDVGASCIGCHDAALHDQVFTQYYPTLRDARAARRAPEND